MLVNLKEVLRIAEERKIAVGAFNCVSIDTTRAIVEAAEELDTPVVLQFAQCHECYVTLEDIGPVMLAYAKKAKVPVAVHLDHGEDIEFIKRALALGFTGVMFDGSNLPYEENVKITKEAVKLAHAVGASVEAELGNMGRRESGSGEEPTSVDDETKIYTDPVKAQDFVKQTGIDALACSFGTTHGIYLKAPRLNFDVVKNVRSLNNNIPVVMHGGSGVSAEDFHKAISAGVRKINYFTYMDKAAGASMKEKANTDKIPFATELNLKARAAMKENLKEAITVFLGK